MRVSALITNTTGMKGPYLLNSTESAHQAQSIRRRFSDFSTERQSGSEADK
jgi:hypothetical protein